MVDSGEVPTLFGSLHREPLAAQLRPRSISDVLGQEHLVGLGRPLRAAIERGDVPSMILWGPPGSGKTTIARLIATQVRSHFEPFSAVTQGIPRVREIIGDAEKRVHREGRHTILFCDEIHRFNKAQQDAFLPWVEEGIITLVGATTENPSFEINSALLSRVQVYVLNALSPGELRLLVERAVAFEAERQRVVEFTADAIDMLVRHADGDARRLLNAVERVVQEVSGGVGAEASVSSVDLEALLARRMPRYDKAGEEHYNLVSALHKSVRGSDVEASLYWLARMLAAGEDPLYVARRVVRMAMEDIGLADPRALSIAMAAKDAYHFIGSPEGDLALAEAVVYLATAPKSNKVYDAWRQATDAAGRHPNAPVPIHLRNAPTKLMKDLGYGADYRYDHAEGGFSAGQRYLPDVLADSEWFKPGDAGFERTLRERLEWWRRQSRADAEDSESQEPDRP